MTTRTQGTVDRLDLSRVLDSSATSSPRVTLYIPTPDTGPQAAIASDILRAQIKETVSRLTEAGVDRAEADEILAPASRLVGDSTWWREQSRGLVIFAAKGYHQAFRIPVEVTESLSVGDHFHLLPLARVLDTTGKCYVLTVSKNHVRLFDATRNTIEELPLGNIPASFDDVVDDIPEKQLQAHPTGGGNMVFHGHADSNDTEWMLTEEFLREVGKGVGEELGTARSQPLVLASVAEYLPAFLDSCPYPAIHDTVIAGNHDRTGPEDLRSSAWSLLGEKVAAGEESELERARSLAHNGRGSFDVAEISRAATEGRVDTLFVPPQFPAPDVTEDTDVTGAPDTPVPSGAVELLDTAVADTIRNGGRVRVPTHRGQGGEVLATFRH